jgi:hypothetical protein
MDAFNFKLSQIFLAALTVVCVGCTSSPEETEQVERPAVSLAKSERFAASAAAHTTECVGDTKAIVDVAGTFEVEGSIDAIDIRAKIDGGASQSNVGVLLPGDFKNGGKSAAYAVTLAVPNGAHSVSLCFAQLSTGEENCTSAVAVKAACNG